MNKMNLVIKLDNSLEHTIVELHQDGEPIGHIYLDPTATENFIHDLANARSQLKEQVPQDIDPGARLLTLANPIWRSFPDNHPDGRMLSLRHPGLGWLHYLFPHKEAAHIAEWLSKDLSELLQKDKK